MIIKEKTKTIEYDVIHEGKDYTVVLFINYEDASMDVNAYKFRTRQHPTHELRAAICQAFIKTYAEGLKVQK